MCLHHPHSSKDGAIVPPKPATGVLSVSGGVLSFFLLFFIWKWYEIKNAFLKHTHAWEFQSARYILGGDHRVVRKTDQ